jgi:hypothetical protein
MKVTKIYLDMDGVLCHFQKRFNELFGVQSSEVRNRKNFTEHWPLFVAQEQFETLEWFPGAHELLEFVNASGIEIEILSSSGGERFHTEVQKQKNVWLKSKDIGYPVNIVPGRKFKSDYATPTTILIDDTEDIIVNFNAAGGIGILHKDINETLDRLRILLK